VGALRVGVPADDPRGGRPAGRGVRRGLPLGEWVRVAHTYDGGEGRVYVNGKLDASAKPRLDITSPARLWIGGWYDTYDFVGDIDEVRVSKVARAG
jgi:hypothetical protein